MAIGPGSAIEISKFSYDYTAIPPIEYSVYWRRGVALTDYIKVRTIMQMQVIKPKLAQ